MVDVRRGVRAGEGLDEPHQHREMTRKKHVTRIDRHGKHSDQYRINNPPFHGLHHVDTDAEDETEVPVGDPVPY